MIPFLIFSVCLVGADAEATAKNDIIVHGRVISADGRPAAKAIVGTNWTPMGWYDEVGKRHSLANIKFPADDPRWIQGEMQPTSPNNGVITDEKGEFVLNVRKGCSILLAFDDKQECSGLADFDSRHMTEALEIQLVPAIEVTGKMIVKSTGAPADWSLLHVDVADEPADVLAFRRFMTCWATDGSFKFKLPPGSYYFAANTDPEALVLRNDPTAITLLGDRLKVNVGELLLKPGEPTRNERIEVAKKEKRVVEVKELIGKPMPPWFVTDARGIDPKAGIEQFSGRWTLIYFWHRHCHPCAGTEVRKLTKFLADQTSPSDKVAVVSFLLGAKSWKTIADADKFLEPIGQQYWAAPWKRLPQAFDNTNRTRESIAEELFGQWVLLDPSGVVVATGSDTSVGLDALKEKAGL